MLVHTLEQAQMPALALLAQIAQPLGHLRPADGVGGVADGIVDAVDCAVFVQLDHQLHILAHGLVVVAAHGDDRVLLNSPNAPEMMSEPLKRSKRMREARKERSYSSTCMKARMLRGSR